MEENKEFYLIVKGEKVIVSEEVYRAYVRPIRAEQRRERRKWRCKVFGEKGNLVRCKRNCAECEYANAGKNATGNALSLDGIKDAGIEIENRELDVEADYIETEAARDRQERLHKAIGELNPRQQEIVKLFYFDRKTQQEIADLYGVSQQAIVNALKKILARLKKIF